MKNKRNNYCEKVTQWRYPGAPEYRQSGTREEPTLATSDGTPVAAD